MPPPILPPPARGSQPPARGSQPAVTRDRFDGESPLFLRAVQDVAREQQFAREERLLTNDALPQPRVTDPLPGVTDPRLGVEQPVETGHTPVERVGALKILSKGEWAHANFPELAKPDRLPTRVLERLRQQYAEYVKLQQETQGMAIKRANANANVLRANTPRGRSTRSGSGLKVPVTDIVQQRADEAMNLGNFNDPNVQHLLRSGGVDPSRGQSSIFDRFGGENINLQVQAATKRFSENPVVGFIETMRQFKPLIAFASDPTEKESIRAFLRNSVIPSPSQIIAAREANEITPAEERIIRSDLFLLQTPQQQEETRALIERRRTETTRTPIGEPTDELVKLKRQRASIKKFQSEAPARKVEAERVKGVQKVRRTNLAFERAAVKNLKATGFQKVTVIDAETGRALPSMGRLSGNIFTKQGMTDEQMRILIAKGLRIPGLDDHLIDEKNPPPLPPVSQPLPNSPFGQQIIRERERLQGG